jgi:hypothetical protein
LTGKKNQLKNCRRQRWPVDFPQCVVAVIFNCPRGYAEILRDIFDAFPQRGSVQNLNFPPRQLEFFRR